MGDGDLESEFFMTTCADCGNEYPVGGTAGQDDSPERAEHHAEDCPIREVLTDRGQTVAAKGDPLDG